MDNKILSIDQSAAAAIEKGRQHGSIKRKRIISNTFIYILLVLMSIVWLVPFVCIVLQSFNVYEASVVNYVVPKKWGLDNYVRLFKETNFFFSHTNGSISGPGWFLNTLIISVVTAVIQTFMVLTMSYTLSRLRFKGRKLLMNFFLILGMFPGFITMIVLYFLLSDLGFTQKGAPIGLILVYTASSGMGYYVSKGFFDTIPKSLDEAARIDGATRAQVMTKVILPLAKPIVIYTILTAFMGPWGDFMFAKFIAFGESTAYNVAVGLQAFLTNDQIGTSYTLFCAGGVIVAIPVTILFMCLQRYYVEGVTGGAVKG